MKLRDYNPDIFEAYATPEEKCNDSLPEPEDEQRRCSYCDSPDIDVAEYDFGACKETGYQDSGVWVKCRSCGKTEDRDG